jgi:hypothetical protein
MHILQDPHTKACHALLHTARSGRLLQHPFTGQWPVATLIWARPHVLICMLQQVVPNPLSTLTATLSTITTTRTNAGGT